MDIKFEIDLDNFVKEMQAYAEEKLKYELRGKILSEINNAKSQLDWKGNFHASYAKEYANSVEKADVGGIVLGWVRNEFKDVIVKHFLNQIDTKEFIESLKKDDEFISIVADRVARKRNLVKQIDEKAEESKGGD